MRTRAERTVLAQCIVARNVKDFKLYNPPLQSLLCMIKTDISTTKVTHGVAEKHIPLMEADAMDFFKYYFEEMLFPKEERVSP